MSDAAPFKLPYGRHHVDEDDIAAVAAVLRSERLTTGPAVEAFEDAFAAAVGAGQAVACSSGTAALHLAALAAGLGPGTAAIVPAITFLATANAVRFTGAEVIFADVDPETGLMTAAHLEAAIAAADRGRLTAVLPVDLNGQSVDMPAIAEVAARHGLRIVEDACHALGGTCRSGDGEVPVGACRDGEMATFSGHPVKTVATGEGGVVTTNDAAFAARMRRLRNHGMVREADAFAVAEQAFDARGEANPWYYEMQEIGFNYRLSDIHCALGLSQLAKLERFVARRRALVARYRAALAPLAPVVTPLAEAGTGAPAWHVAVVLIDFEAAGTGRAEVMRRLARAGIGTQVLYIPLYRQPYYRARYGEKRLPGAERYYARALVLPLFVDMKDGDVDRVVEALAAALGLAG